MGEVATLENLPRLCEIIRDELIAKAQQTRDREPVVLEVGLDKLMQWLRISGIPFDFYDSFPSAPGSFQRLREALAAQGIYLSVALKDASDQPENFKLQNSITGTQLPEG